MRNLIPGSLHYRTKEDSYVKCNSYLKLVNPSLWSRIGRACPMRVTIFGLFLTTAKTKHDSTDFTMEKKISEVFVLSSSNPTTPIQSL